MTDIPDPVLPSERRVSITFERTLSDGDYGGTKVSAWVQGNVAVDADESAVAAELGKLLVPAAAAVFDQLNISYVMDEFGVLREADIPVKASRVEKAFGATQVSDGNSGGGGSGNLRVMNPADQDGPLPEWIFEATAKDGVTGVWDNRKKVTTNQPWFREAVANGKTGHGKDGAPKGYWPPK